MQPFGSLARIITGILIAVGAPFACIGPYEAAEAQQAISIGVPMRTKRFALAMAALLMAACRQAAPTVTPGPTAEAVLTPTEVLAPTTTAVPEATLPATSVPPPLPSPTSTLAPTPTSFAEGLTVRLGTPDPSPNCPNHYPWFFENPAAECADFVHNTWTVLQPFEHGLMVWFQDQGRTYVLLDDGSLFKPYRQVFDLQGLPLPEPDPGIIPPAGLYQPTLGFALFWRGLVPGHEWVREGLGWATAPETAYSGLWQCNTATGDALKCYFTGPHDELISMALGSAQYWNYRQTAVR
jgi:hypothetical protein